MMTSQEIKEIVSSITYKPDWAIKVGKDGDRLFLQATVAGEDSVTACPTVWKTGKRYLSLHMSRQEVVGAVFGLIKDAEEHEMREWFRYRGASIFNPHLDPDVLAEVARKKASFVFRENAMSMEEAA
ncbi:MAG: hypothetical protein EPO10_17720 [Reyranella sp.]|uniref:hypothetical protein n=1 Tax=Reyranella sp. TaxID=1929291 RepID=UPI001202F028|nr:hypothetical protein [Reyranella sp.]TAJ97178.1 MAG: hypothetical protein EPO41_04075 [Reyranella sp.]TBR27518.1 MAG: hypothetical protein EPO10_17720 [Reyranella sp.]